METKSFSTNTLFSMINFTVEKLFHLPQTGQHCPSGVTWPADGAHSGAAHVTAYSETIDDIVVEVLEYTRIYAITKGFSVYKSSSSYKKLLDSFPV